MAAYVWAAASAGNWSVGGNWKVGGVAQAAPPTTNDTVTFGSGTGFTQSNCTVDISAVSSTINFTGYTGTLTWNAAQGITVSGSGSTIFVSTMTNSMNATSFLTFTGAATMRPGGKTFAGTVTFNTGGAFATNGGIFNKLTINGAANKTDSFALPANTMTVTGTLTLGGNTTQGVNRLYILSNAIGNQRTFACSGAAVVINGDVDFQDITITGSPSWTNTGSAYIGDGGGNGGAVSSNTTTPAAQTWQTTGAGSWSDPTKWTSRVPLPQDNATLSSAFSGSPTITADMPRMGKNIDFSASTGTLTLTLTVAGGGNSLVYGNWALRSGITCSAQRIEFHGRGSQTLTSGGVNIPFGFTMYPQGGSYTLQDDTSWVPTGVTSAPSIVNLGTFITNGFGLTCYSLVCNSGGSVTLSTSIVTITCPNNAVIPWQNLASPATNFSAASATIIFNAASVNSRTFAGGGVTYGTLTYTVAGSTGSLVITGANTFTTINFSDATNARTLTLPASTTTTVTNFNVFGTSGKLMTVNSSVAGTAATVSSPNGIRSSDYLTLQDSTATGGATWYAGANSTSVSGNTGWNFTAPSAEFLMFM